MHCLVRNVASSNTSVTIAMFTLNCIFFELGMYLFCAYVLPSFHLFLLNSVCYKIVAWLREWALESSSLGFELWLYLSLVMWP